MSLTKQELKFLKNEIEDLTYRLEIVLGILQKSVQGQYIGSKKLLFGFWYAPIDSLPNDKFIHLFKNIYWRYDSL